MFGLNLVFAAVLYDHLHPEPTHNCKVPHGDLSCAVISLAPSQTVRRQNRFSQGMGIPPQATGDRIKIPTLPASELDS